MDGKSARTGGLVAIVTGAGRGIGRAMAERLAGAGVQVVVADIDFNSAQETSDRINKRNQTAIAVEVDVTKASSVNSLLAKTLEAYGQVDILVNNAGIMHRTRILELPLEEWEQTIKVNLTGPFLCIKAVLPVMKGRGFGRIVNISSSAGRSVSTLGGAHYTASKAGLLGLTRAVAKEMAPFGITVNAICPGLIDTDMVRKTTTPEELQNFLDSFPARRMGTPEEIGDLVVFLCSESASYITGASLDINGGDLMI
jgi:NAD(P)-dependent dehydrogenase (short-subunit alcohol dehydrogenase family)